MNYQKSSLSIYNTASQTLATNTPVNFINAQKTGCSIQFNGTTSITLNRPGLYYVNLSATGVESGTAGNITIQMYNNGVAVPGATATEYSGDTSSIENLSFGAIIEVKPSCPSTNNTAVLTFINTGTGTTYSNVIVNIFKLA